MTRTDTPSENQPLHTPSTNRQRLAPTNAATSDPAPHIRLPSIHTGGISGVSNSQHRSMSRQPLANLTTNSISPSGFAGYGLSAGLKVSNSAATVANGLGRPIVRSRGLSFFRQSP
jgi:E3 ubiquitin-protein ligase CCNP1IP1